MKNGRPRIRTILLVIASLLALHQFTIFVRYFPIKHFYGIPKTHFWSKDDAIFKTSEDRLWLVGDWQEDPDDGPTRRWGPLLKTYPNDPAVAARLVGNLPLPDDYLEKSSKLDPENGWFDLLIAARHAEGAFSEKRVRRQNQDSRERRRRRSSYETTIMVDEKKVEKALTFLIRASEKPRLDPYVRTFLERWQTTTNPITDLTTAYQYYGIWTWVPAGKGDLAPLAKAFEHRMKSLAEGGKREEFFSLLGAFEKILWKWFDTANTTLELLRTRNNLDSIAELMGTIENFDLGKIAEPYQVRMDRLKDFHTRDEDSEDHLDGESISRKLFNPVAMNREEMRTLVSDRELRPGVLAEQANISWRFYLWGFLILSVSTIIFSLVSLRLKREKSNLPKLTTLIAVALPVLAFFVIRYATPWGGFYKGPG